MDESRRHGLICDAERNPLGARIIYGVTRIIYSELESGLEAKSSEYNLKTYLG